MTEGTITIELVRTRPETPTGSGLPDLGHTAYQLMKSLPALPYKDVGGKLRPLGDHFRIRTVSTSGDFGENA